MNTNRKYWIGIAIVAGMFAGTVAQAQLIAYPAHGQSQQRQQRDENECFTWAQNNTGIDPSTLQASQLPAGWGSGHRLRGAAVGAAGGAAIGAISGGNAGRGAAVGAVGGTVVGAAQSRSNQRTNNVNNADVQNAVDSFNRAWSACMQGRGYTVR